MTTYPFGTSTGDREFTEADEQQERWAEAGEAEATYCVVGCNLYINYLSGRERCHRCKGRDEAHHQTLVEGIELLWRIAMQELRRNPDAAEFIDHFTVEGEVMRSLVAVMFSDHPAIQRWAAAAERYA